MGFSYEQFQNVMRGFPDTPSGGIIGVGVSGGPDSMALLWLLSRWGQEKGVTVKAYTVDHGLRVESAQEAQKVASWIKDWPHISHEILRWEGAKPETRILEEARAARYALIADAMKKGGAAFLFVAHHRDDQAETFLIRLAKGSGLDGLSGMRPIQKMDAGVTLLRPLLDVSKEDLILLCKENDIPYVDDPTNKNEHYLRPRLRGARDVLAEEGLTSKRLGLTAKRLARASFALEELAQDLFTAAMIEKAQGGFVFDFRILAAAPEELIVRVLLQAMEEIHPEDEYGPRLEKVENLLERILRDLNFKGATLGGCIFAKDAKNETLRIEKE